MTRSPVTDRDPELRVTLTKADRRRTFDVRPTKFHGRWLVLETGAQSSIRVVGDETRALTAREALDRKIRALLEDGWEPM